MFCCWSHQFSWPESYSEARIQLRTGELRGLLCYKYVALACGTQRGDTRGLRWNCMAAVASWLRLSTVDFWFEIAFVGNGAQVGEGAGGAGVTDVHEFCFFQSSRGLCLLHSQGQPDESCQMTRPQPAPRPGFLDGWRSGMATQPCLPTNLSPSRSHKQSSLSCCSVTGKWWQGILRCSQGGMVYHIEGCIEIHKIHKEMLILLWPPQQWA